MRYLSSKSRYIAACTLVVMVMLAVTTACGNQKETKADVYSDREIIKQLQELKSLIIGLRSNGRARLLRLKGWIRRRLPT